MRRVARWWTVRDLDDGGQLLWIPDSKTEAGKRESRFAHTACDGLPPAEHEVTVLAAPDDVYAVVQTWVEAFVDQQTLLVR